MSQTLEFKVLLLNHKPMTATLVARMEGPAVVDFELRCGALQLSFSEARSADLAVGGAMMRVSGDDMCTLFYMNHILKAREQLRSRGCIATAFLGVFHSPCMAHCVYGPPHEDNCFFVPSSNEDADAVVHDFVPVLQLFLHPEQPHVLSGALGTRFDEDAVFDIAVGDKRWVNLFFGKYRPILPRSDDVLAAWRAQNAEVQHLWRRRSAVRKTGARSGWRGALCGAVACCLDAAWSWLKGLGRRLGLLRVPKQGKSNPKRSKNHGKEARGKEAHGKEAHSKEESFTTPLMPSPAHIHSPQQLEEVPLLQRCDWLTHDALGVASARLLVAMYRQEQIGCLLARHRKEH